MICYVKRFGMLFISLDSILKYLKKHINLLEDFAKEQQKTNDYRTWNIDSYSYQSSWYIL